MRRCTMRIARLAGAMALALGVQGCGGARSEPTMVRSNGLEITVAAEPEAFRVGKNHLWIELRDAEGRPIPGAELRVRVHMHAMGAMPAMGGPAAVEDLGEGRYRADFELEMGSTWQVEIDARTPEGRMARAEGSLTVGTPGVRLVGVSTGGPQVAEESREPEAPRPGEFRVAPDRLQRIGVRLGRAERRPLELRLRAAGRVVAEEPTLEDVALKVRGWVREVRVDALGDPVRSGQVLFTVYSPELYAAQEEYLQALRSRERARETAAPDRADYLVAAARNRLRLWDISEADLARLAERGEPLEALPIRARTSGYVVEKNVARGSAFEPGMRLYRIAPLNRVWVEAEVYEFELLAVREGQRARITLPYLPGRSFDARVSYVHPVLDPQRRTLRVRLELPNPELELRPEMYVNVSLYVERGEGLVVPDSAVLYAGERSFVFRALGDGRFRPQPVVVGLRTGEGVEIVEGLEEGDAIVTSGTFLIASESRLRAALDQWR